MVNAQVLEATHTVDDIRVVENTVLVVDNRVAGVDDRVASVDDKVTIRLSTTKSRWSLMVRNRFLPANKTICLTLICLVMDQVKRSWSPCWLLLCKLKPPHRIGSTNYDRTFANGSIRRIRLLTTTLHVVPIASKEPSVFFQESIFTEWKFNDSLLWLNVRSPDISSITTLKATSCRGLWEERTLVCPYQILS